MANDWDEPITELWLKTQFNVGSRLSSEKAVVPNLFTCRHPFWITNQFSHPHLRLKNIDEDQNKRSSRPQMSNSLRKIKWRPKKKVITSADVKFSSQSQVKTKKKEGYRVRRCPNFSRKIKEIKKIFELSYKRAIFINPAPLGNVSRNPGLECWPWNQMWTKTPTQVFSAVSWLCNNSVIHN